MDAQITFKILKGHSGPQGSQKFGLCSLDPKLFKKFSCVRLASRYFTNVVPWYWNHIILMSLRKIKTCISPLRCTVVNIITLLLRCHLSVTFQATNSTVLRKLLLNNKSQLSFPAGETATTKIDSIINLFHVKCQNDSVHYSIAKEWCIWKRKVSFMIFFASFKFSKWRLAWH